MAYLFSVKYFKNAIIRAYAGLRVKQLLQLLCDNDALYC